MLSPTARETIVDTIRSETARVPETAFGIISDGQLHEVDGRDRIFRVASITKSFTAAALTGLVRGLVPGKPVRMDDAVLDWVPELADAGWAEDAVIDDLLRMSSGLPTDDPWADRQESMSAEDFSDLLGKPAIRDFPAGTAYRYSNLGYAVAGLVIERAAQKPFAQLIDDVFLTPLGMTSSGFDVRRLDADRLVTGYRRNRDGELEPQAISLPGAFSAIGGLASTVDDLSVWVRAHIDAVSPEGDDAAFRALAAATGDGTPQRARLWRRVLADQQQPVRTMEITHGTSATGPKRSEQFAVSGGYGLGLRCYFDTRYGSFAGHSGGYPGFGLHMRWHAASRTGVILFTALTGYPTEAVTAKALEAGLEVQRGEDPDNRAWPRSEAPTATPTGPAAGRVVPVRSVAEFLPDERALELARIAENMIRTGDDSAAESVFSMNVDLDQPRRERLAAWAAACEHTGDIEQASIEPRFTGASSAQWTVTGAAGSRTVTMTLNPYQQIQGLSIRLH